MSRTNTWPEVCSRCGAIVPARQGTIRTWLGQARKSAPKYATRSAFGIITACHCNACESDIARTKRLGV